MQPYILAIGASVLKTFSTISEKQVLTRAEPRVFTGSASLLIAFASLPLLFLAEKSTLTLYIFFLICISGIFSTASAITSAYVLKHLDISESASLFALSPAVITLLSMIFLNERLYVSQIIGIALSCVGIFILEGHKHSAKQDSHLPALTSNISHIDINQEKPRSKFKIYTVLLAALFFFSANAVLDKYVIDTWNINPILFLIIIQFFILFNFMILDLFTRKASHDESFDFNLLKRKSFWAHIFFVVLHRVVHVFAMRDMSISILHTIKQFSAVLTTILGGKLFTEKHMVRRTSACLCIVVGVVLAIV